jgi:hypothetical protein
MTDEPPFSPRFLVRQGTRGWMVWDRHAKGPAQFHGRQAVGLAEERAREIMDALTRQYIAEGG